MGANPRMDTFNQTPVFRFVPDSITSPDVGRTGEQGAKESPQPASLQPELEQQLHGAILGQDEYNHLLWLAAWSSKARRYDLLELRPALAEKLRTGLEYRDAMAIAFFSTYLLPHLSGFLVGFGSGNIFRRLRQEAPIGAIRRSVADVLRASERGMRVSGLEEHFAHLMHEVGALDMLTGLEAVHGAEPMHLFTSSYSKDFFFTWGNGLEYRAALKALQIEGDINRFAQVSAVLERNRRRGLGPVEDNASQKDVAHLDFELLKNPAIIALPLARFEHPAAQPRLAHGLEVSEYPAYAHEVATEIAQAAHRNGFEGVLPSQHSEWVYRQAISALIRRLRLPFRFDAEFRSHLAAGKVAIGFTTAGMAMMPQSQFDEALGDWRALSRDERASMSANYNLRVGMMLVALGFGADEGVQEVTLQIDSIGLEEAVEEQDSAIAQMLTDALAAFEQARTGHGLGTSGAKGDPKDGDIHGNPINAALPPSQRPHGAASQQQGPRPEDHEDLEAAFNEVMQGVELDDSQLPEDAGADSVNSGESVEPEDGTDGDGIDSTDGDSADVDADAADSDATDDGDGVKAKRAAGGADSTDPMSIMHKNPTVRRMLIVTFTRHEFLQLLETAGLTQPRAAYKRFNARMNLSSTKGLSPIDAESGWRDSAFAPVGAQEEPELSEKVFSPQVASVLGAKDSLGLSIQREDLLQRAEAYFNELSRTESLTPVESARRAMKLVERISDPELSQKVGLATGALIDSLPTPDITFEMSKAINTERLQARDELFKGQTEQAVTIAEQTVARYDAVFAGAPGIPRYFNSYAERVVYNKLFATPNENTVLIPDNLFYAHMELADLLAQLSGPQESIKHLNSMVAYAPAYPLSHLRLAAQLARIEDWDSARAATLNALRVALDRDDAAFAYYRYAYSAWMRDEFDLAVAGYMLSDAIRPNAIPALKGELTELLARVESQRIEVPHTVEEASALLAEEGVPVWPSTEVTKIVQCAARVAVDEGLFVPARTLALASARLDDSSEMGLDMVQSQFLRSLNA